MWDTRESLGTGMWSVVGRVMSPLTPTNVPILLSLNCECILLHNKRNFADGIKAKDLKLGNLSWVTWMCPV